MRLLPFVLIFLVFARPYACFDMGVFSRTLEKIRKGIDSSLFKTHILKGIWDVGLIAVSSFTTYVGTLKYFALDNKPVGVIPKANLLPDPPHDFIIPRNKSLLHLQDMFRRFGDEDGKVNIIYVVGNQGMGKTELARQYGDFEFERNRTHTVVHLNMTSETVFRESLIKVITETDLQTDNCSSGLIDYDKKLRQQTITDLMKPLCRLLKKRSDWLLIVDDIKKRDITEYEMYKTLPQPGTRRWGTGRMIVTTRLKLAPYASDHVKIFHTQGLGVDEARKLLYLVTGEFPRERSSSCMEHIAYKLHKSPRDIINVGFAMRKREILDKIDPLPKMPCYPYKDSDIIINGRKVPSH